MTNWPLVKKKRKIDALFKNEEIILCDLELQAHWAKYLCVLVSGFLENSLKELYGNFANRTASPQVASFVNSELRQIGNANTDRFLRTAEAFSKTWKQDLKEYLDNDGRKEAINSIIGHRHQIAHGGNSMITMVTLKEYFSKAVEVVEFVENQCQ